MKLVLQLKDKKLGEVEFSSGNMLEEITNPIVIMELDEKVLHEYVNSHINIAARYLK